MRNIFDRGTNTVCRAAKTGIFAYLIACLLVPFVVGQSNPGQKPDLYQGFQDPPSKYKPLPLWYWNSKIEPEELKRQVDEYIKQGAQGAVVYGCTGLKTPFLSEEWWHVWGELLAYARSKGFQLGWHPEFNIPTGDARDMWKDPPNQSRVLEGHPEYRLKRLAYIEREASGPGKVSFDDLPNPVLAIAARKLGPQALDADSLVDLSDGIHGAAFSTELKSGSWKITFYYPTITNTAAWGWTEWEHVDPLNRQATDRYIDLTLGELARRFPEYMGSTFKYVLLDSEGSFGGPIVWTPGVFETFQAKKGYDLRKYLPLLVNDGGPITAKIRNDYYDIASGLFVDNFFKPISDWASARGIEAVAQEFGDGLQYEAGFGGNFMRIQNAMTLPFLEDLGDDFRIVRQFKEPESIAHFEGKRFWCECQLIQGAGSYMSPQKMRFGANVIGAWGVSLWSQNTSYEDSETWWPPSMGRSQPYWKYFHHYADLMKRLAYMNDGGRHVADVLLFRPTASVIAEAAPAFDNNRGNFFGRQRKGYPPIELGSHRENVAPTEDAPDTMWGGDFSWHVEMDYWGLMQLLVQKQQDYDVVDDLYLGRAKLNQGALQLADESYHMLVLPPMRVISKESLAKIRQFYEQGGDVIAYGSLPWGSTDKGMEDEEVIATVNAIFGIDPRESEQATQEIQRASGQTGHAVFIPNGLEKVTDVIARLRPPDFQVARGSTKQLFYAHRVKEGQDLYWVVNDSEKAREIVLSLAAQGKPELWDPADGTRKPSVYWQENGRTVVPLKLNAWDGMYVVLAPKQDAGPQVTMTGTNIVGLELQEHAGTVGAKGWISASEKEGWMQGSWKGKPFRAAKENRQPAKLQALSPQGWEFQVEGSGVEVLYGQTALVGDGEGEAMGFGETGYNDRAWETVWLSRQSKTIREWNVIGPFPNVDHQGFNEVYPPEKETNFDARYVGADGQQVTWLHYTSNTPETHVQKALALTDAKAVVYALTYVWSPKAQQVQTFLTGENMKLFVNDKEAYKLHPMPVDSELRDGFAFTPMIQLNEGWNKVLVKVEHDSNPIAFFLRLSDMRGVPVPELLFSARPDSPEKLRSERAEASKFRERWYRVQVPAGTRALQLPAIPKLSAVYLNGKQVAADPGARVELNSLEWDHPNVIALVTADGYELEDVLHFEGGKSNYQLGSWTWTGLSSFSGGATYEKSFRLDPGLVGKRVELDLGQVGVTAEVWLNDKRVGERVWEPYRLDVTEYLHEGENHLKIAVTNSDSNRRAEPNPRRYIERRLLPGGNAVVYMDVLSLNGLLGPVKLIPYEKVELRIPQ